MFNKWKKVFVGEKEGEVILNTEGGNYYVGSFSNSYAFLAECSVVFCASIGSTFAKHVINCQRIQHALGGIVVLVAFKALQYLKCNQVANCHRFRTERAVKNQYFRSVLAVEEIYPNASINKNHLANLI